ncbi:MAG: hypothetical protein ACK41U_12305 [Paracoccus sp. (in: a-proteobacteria)]|uniref:hypothetical protein n=1 Tax=Paracoccus sp. TaxID=267 RepID=UPI00391DD020
MAQITGIVTVRHAGKDYSLMLGMSGLAKLQQDYGKDLAPLVAMFEEKVMPDFAVLLRVTQIALERFHPDADDWLADDMLQHDFSVGARVIREAFESLQKATPAVSPDAAPVGTTSGNVAKPRAKKAKPARRG